MTIMIENLLTTNEIIDLNSNHEILLLMLYTKFLIEAERKYNRKVISLYDTSRIDDMIDKYDGDKTAVKNLLSNIYTSDVSPNIIDTIDRYISTKYYMTDIMIDVDSIFLPYIVNIRLCTIIQIYRNDYEHDSRDIIHRDKIRKIVEHINYKILNYPLFHYSGDKKCNNYLDRTDDSLTLEDSKKIIKLYAKLCSDDYCFSIFSTCQSYVKQQLDEYNINREMVIIYMRKILFNDMKKQSTIYVSKFNKYNSFNSIIFNNEDNSINLEFVKQIIVDDIFDTLNYKCIDCLQYKERIARTPHCRCSKINNISF